MMELFPLRGSKLRRSNDAPVRVLFSHLRQELTCGF
jgi:hypothetical protein